MGAGCVITCPNAHGMVELVTTKCMAGGGIFHEMSCGCRNTGPQIQAGAAVSGTTVQAGTPITKPGWSQRDKNL